MDAIQFWQMQVAKASLSFSTLNVELKDCGAGTGSAVFAFDQDDSCMLSVHANSGTKLLELNNTRVKTKHVRAMLLFMFGFLSCVANEADEPVKKRGRQTKNTTTTTTTPAVVSAPHMSASFANTPIRWDDISNTNTIDTMIAFLE